MVESNEFNLDVNLPKEGTKAYQLKNPEQIHQAFECLVDQKNWQQRFVPSHEEIGYYSSPAARHAQPGTETLWLIAGIHGEEVAPPNAFSEPEVINMLGSLSETRSIICWPLMNPEGYLEGIRNVGGGRSVTNSERWLPKNRRLFSTPASQELVMDANEAVVNTVIDLLNSSPPNMVLDCHEDIFDRSFSTHDPRAIIGSYVFASCVPNYRRNAQKISQEILNALRSTGLKIQTHGTTDIGETINNGVVWNVRDHSIDYLMTNGYYINNSGKLIHIPRAKAGFVVETVVPHGHDIPLVQRVEGHKQVLLALSRMIKYLDTES